MVWQCVGINHIHFYVDAIAPVQTILTQQWQFQPQRVTDTDSTRTVWLYRDGITLALSAALTPTSPVAAWRQMHSEGVADLAIAIQNLACYPYGEWVEPGRKVIQTPFGMVHSLVEAVPAEPIATAVPYFSHIDHAVLNVPAADFEAACAWYRTYLDLEPAETFDITTTDSGLRSVVMRSAAGLQLPINAPTNTSSQIQEFLDHHGGAGIQHVALHCHNSLAAVQALKQRGVAFLPVPAQYYARLNQPELAAAGMLVDPLPPRDRPWPVADHRYLLQTFTQPVFAQPTFFWEIIERVNQQPGFGEANFQALYEAVESEQRKRSSAAAL